MATTDSPILGYNPGGGVSAPGGDEPSITEFLPLETRTGKVKITSSLTGTLDKPIDFTDVFVIGLDLGGGVGAVSSVFGRTGDVVAQANDYSFAQLSGKPTTLSGYGITDAQPLDADLTAIAALAGQTGFGQGFLTQANAAAARTYIGAGTSNFDGTFTSLSGKPTTLVGYGITDAQPLDTELTSLAALVPAGNGLKIVRVNSGGTGFELVAPTGGGSVTDFSAGDLAPLFTTTEATTTTTPALSFALTSAAATTVFGRAAGTSGAPTYSSSPQFLAIGNLTSNGFVKTGGGVGTLSVDTSTYLTANQNISLTGDVTGGPSATSIATTYNNAVPTAKAGVLTGGTTDQVLAKNSNTNYDLKWTTLAGGGNVSNSGTPTANQLPIWISATAIKGVTGLTGGATGDVLKKNSATDYDWAWGAGGAGGTPGGSNTQVQYNNSGAFAGNAGLVFTNFSNSNILAMQGPGTATSWQFLATNSTGSPSLAPLNSLSVYNAATGNAALVFESNNIYANAAGVIGWQNSSIAGTLDTGFYRNAAGVVEINNGTPGTYRDLKLRTLTLSGATTIGISAPSASTGTFLKDDGTWATPPGGAGGTPGGSTTQVQFNNSGAFGGDAGLTYAVATTAQATLSLQGTGGSQWSFNAAGSVGVAGYTPIGSLALYNSATTNTPLVIAGENVYVDSSSVIGWQNAGRGGTLDTGFYRNAAGVVEVNNGTPGTYRDLKLRTLTFSAITSSLLKADGSGNAVAATAGTDYTSPTGTETLTNKKITQRISSQASNATWSPNADTTDVFVLTLQVAAVTLINNPSGTPTDGQNIIIRAKCDGTARAISGWASQYRFSSDMAAPSTLLASKTTYLGFIYNATDTKWDNVAKMENF